MSILNLGSPSNAPRASKPLKLILGAGVLAGVIALGSTLAANIALNTGAPIEFGQGVAQTTSCDGDITLTPISTFVNADGAGEFKFTAIKLSGLDTTDQAGPSEGCAGKTFTIKIYDANGDEDSTDYALTVGSSAFISAAGSFSLPDGFDSSNTSVTLTFDPASIAATDVYRITIESAVASPSPSPSFTPTSYEIGDTGPGGGNVFYYSAEGFDELNAPCSPSCHYLEAAPTDSAQTRYWTDATYEWSGNTSEAVDVTSTAIGSGFLNTYFIFQQPNGGSTAGRAATIAHLYRGPGDLDDWFLPSQGELNQMCKWARAVAWTSDATPCEGGTLNLGTGAGQGAAGFAEDGYWSSSEFDALSALGQSFYNGRQSDVIKAVPLHVRPIRAF